MTRKNCICGKPMDGYTRASADSKILLTTWLCTYCFRRKYTSEGNPHFFHIPPDPKKPRRYQPNEREF